ncbi:MAG: flagellar filament capping protein FliD [Rhodocyclales bacterium]|nr:flagellar filament capping protein FliD [Rhodocyclales bacterium]
MATLSSAGIGSGLNVESLISGLMQIERQPLTSLQTQQSTAQSKISALGTIKSNLASLQNAAKALTPTTLQTATSALSNYTAALTDTTIGSASATSSAVPGTYSIEVTALANEQRYQLGKSYASTDAVIDFGGASTKTLSFTKGSTTVNVTLDTTQNTLGGIRDAINKAGTGLNATVVTGTDGKQNLLLSAATGGTANTVSIGGTAQFIDSSNPSSPIAASSAFNQTQAATDAVVKVQGVSISTAGNTITGAVDGVTLNLTKTGTTTLTVSRDTSALQTKLQTLVNSYNTLNSSTSSSIKQLADIGVSFQTDGSLSLDTAKFSKAATTDFAATASVIAYYSKALKSDATAMLDTNGTLTNRTTGLNSTVKNLGKQIDAMNTRLTRIENNYRSQYTALDKAMSSMSTTSSYLTQQLALL